MERGLFSFLVFSQPTKNEALALILPLVPPLDISNAWTHVKASIFHFFFSFFFFFLIPQHILNNTNGLWCKTVFYKHECQINPTV